MSANIALEEIVGKLLDLSKRKPLRERDHSKAKELMIKLKEMGFINQQISELTDGGWSESTVKVNTRGTVVRNPGPKENAMKLITQLVNMDLTLEDVGSSVSMKEDLDAKGLVFEDLTSLLKETKKNKVDPKDLIQLDKDLKESKLTFPQLKEAISYKSELKKAGLTLEGIKKIHQTSKTYGGYDEVLGAINAYGSLVSIEAEINKKTPTKKSLEKQVGDLDSKIENLEGKKEQIEGALKLHKELEDLGFDKATLQELKKSSENYGKVKEVLAMVNTYTNLAELKTKVEELQNEKKEVDTEGNEVEHSWK